MSHALTIGRVAKLAGVNVETIRYYQRRGLLDEPSKPHGSFRRYPPSIVARIHFIKRAQTLGFTLEEVSSLFRLEKASACAETRTLAAQKIDLIDRKIQDLTSMRQALANLVKQCDAGEPAGGCPIIELLARE